MSTGPGKSGSNGIIHTGRKDLIFIMAPCKGNAHRDESTKHRGGRTYNNYLGKATLKFGTGPVRKKSLKCICIEIFDNFFIG